MHLKMSCGMGYTLYITQQFLLINTLFILFLGVFVNMIFLHLKASIFVVVNDVMFIIGPHGTNIKSHIVDMNGMTGLCRCGE